MITFRRGPTLVRHSRLPLLPELEPALELQIGLLVEIPIEPFERQSQAAFFFRLETRFPRVEQEADDRTRAPIFGLDARQHRLDELEKRRVAERRRRLRPREIAPLVEHGAEKAEREVAHRAAHRDQRW